MTQRAAEANVPAGPPLQRLSLPKPTPMEWICLIGGLALTLRYAWLLDDAYVYFRYVDNLLYLGRGLVFNAGEYVEGFSSPLWVLLLIGLRSTGLNFWIITRLIAVVAFVLFWLVLVLLNRRLSPPHSPTVNFPLCYLAFNYGVLSYFTSGTESPLVQVAAGLYALWVLNPRSRGLQLSLAFTPILRHELAVPFAICLVWFWIRDRKFPAFMAFLGLLVTGAWVAFRIYYYADLFPNTFYLKDTVDFAQGLVYLQDTARTYWLYPVLAVFALLTVVCWSWRRAGIGGEASGHAADATDEAGIPGVPLETRKRLLMVVLAVSVGVYVVRIGGDPRHFRFLAFSFCLCICACAGIAEQLLARLSVLRFRGSAALAGALIAVGVGVCYPPQLDRHPLLRLKELRRINKISDAAFFRAPTRVRRFELFPLDWGEKIEFKGEYAEYRKREGGCPHVGLSTRAKCAVHYAGFQDRALHGLGLTDPILARTEMRTDRPGHKYGLAPLAEDLAKIILASGNVPHRGMYREAVEEGRAPRWIAENLESIEIIEQKMFNTHDLLENLRLAFTFPEKIKP